MYDSLARHVKLSLLLLATMGVMSGISIVAALLLISHHFADVPHIAFLSKLLLTIPSLVIAAVAPFAGMIVDRFGRLRPLLTGVVLFIVGGSCGFYLQDFEAILAGRALLGLSVALIITASMALIGDYFDEKGAPPLYVHVGDGRGDADNEFFPGTVFRPSFSSPLWPMPASKGFS
ncbi:MAG: MFS transporter [Campylobacterales bacterium]|nr:MFS transporter [Campylobacterales bacterium]